MGQIEGREVTVLGAGVAGLTVARALAMRGARVTVLEQAEVIREVGAGLQITPNGAAVLRALGLETRLNEVGPRAQAVHLCDGRDGSCVLRMDLARLRPDMGWHFMHRADLIDLLAEAARAAGVQIRLLQRVAQVDLSGQIPVIETAVGERISAPLVIGADGLHSMLRPALNGASRPFFTGQVAWRAVIPGDPSDPAIAEVHMGDGRHLVSYPLRGGLLRNIVAVEERRDWVEEGWNLRDDPMALRLAFEDFGPRVTGWLEQVEQCWLWGLFRHPVAAVWGRALPKGCAAILGDAAHPTLPFLAQGANMALEDAWVLAQMLDKHGPGDAALAAYQSARAARCTRIVAAANRNARAYHLSGIGREIAHAVLRIGGRIAPGAGLARFDWVHGFDVTRG